MLMDRVLLGFTGWTGCYRIDRMLQDFTGFYRILQDGQDVAG